MYKCLICGIRFDVPVPKWHKHMARYNSEYGCTDVMVCPSCGHEEFDVLREVDEDEPEDD